MKRFLLHALLLVTILSITACGSPPAQTGQSAATASPPAATALAAPTASTAQGTTAADGAPVTTMMAELDLAGEPYAAVGDPNAPLTVVEFSDYG